MNYHFYCYWVFGMLFKYPKYYPIKQKRNHRIKIQQQYYSKPKLRRMKWK